MRCTGPEPDAPEGTSEGRRRSTGGVYKAAHDSMWCQASMTFTGERGGYNPGSLSRRYVGHRRVLQSVTKTAYYVDGYVHTI